MEIKEEIYEDYKLFTMIESNIKNTHIEISFKYFNKKFTYSIVNFICNTNDINKIHNYVDLLDKKCSKIDSNIDYSSYYFLSMMSLQLKGSIINYIKNKKNPNKHLYFMLNDNGLIKIGISNNPIKRCKNLERELGDKINIIKVLEKKSTYEKVLHDKFKNLNIPYKGQREWFHPSFNLINFIYGITEENIEKLI